MNASDARIATTIDEPMDDLTPVVDRFEELEYVFQRFACRVTSGTSAGQWRVADGPELTIGSATGNDLEIGDPTISRHHCTVRVSAGGFEVRDLGSKNGTFVGDVRVGSAFLAHGAVLRLGQSKVRFEVLDELIREPIASSQRFGTMIGVSAAMRRLFSLLPRIAGCDTTTLIEGPTGTGKGLLAESIHQASPRASGPFVVVDCGALAPSLVESELYGHERGSFTGAHERRVGAFQAAHGGTIFIDEIGELDAEAQPKLLRVIEKRVVSPVGSSQIIPLDVRVIAATNRDLRTEVNAGRFRADLFYRLNVMRVRMPSLAERAEDIPLLATHFYRELSGNPDAIPPPGLLARWGSQPWGGNVRELRSAVERAMLVGEGPVPEVDGGSLAGQEGSYRREKALALAAWESRFVSDLIRQHGGNISRAARAVKMDRNHLRALLQRYGTAY